jgi:photosystem II stability/assembly factor-like uncharacterized protein
MKKRFISVCIVTVFFLQAIYAQMPWERITPTPQENTLNWIQKIPGTQKLIAVGEGSTVMLSDDAGLSWEIILNPAGMDNDYQCYGTYFINESTGFIYGGRKTILKTTDGGYHWELKYNGQSLYNTSAVRDMDFSDEMRGNAIGNDGVFLETSDGGETWNDVGMSLDFTLNQIEFITASTGYITGTDTTSMLRTLDGGLNWELVPVFSDLLGINTDRLTFINDHIGFMTCAVRAQNTEYMIYKTDDAGQNWTKVFSAFHHWDIRLTFLDTVHGIAGYNAPAYISNFLITNDGGETWLESPQDYIPWFSTNSLCYFSLDRALTVGAKGRIYSSDNQGIVWKKESNLIFNGDIYDVQFTSPLVGYCRSANMEGGIWNTLISKTMDGGQSWHTIAGDIYEGVEAMYFLGDLTGYYSAYGFNGLILYKTDDGGFNWTEIQTGLDINSVVLSFFDQNKGLMADYHWLLSTTDGGNSWQLINDEVISNTEVLDIEYRSQDSIFVVGYDYFEPGIAASYDGGQSWERIPIADFTTGYDICFATDNLAFIASDNSIFKSADGGQSWSKCIVNAAHDIKFKKISFPTPDIGYAVGHGLFENFFKTTDGGDHWEPVNSGTTTNLNSLHFFDELHGLIVGESGLEMRTTTGGIVSVAEDKAVVHQEFFKVTPNPASQYCSVELFPGSKLTEPELVIYNAQGSMVSVHALNEDITRVQLPEVRGLYIFGLYEGHLIKQTRKVMIR